MINFVAESEDHDRTGEEPFDSEEAPCPTSDDDDDDDEGEADSTDGEGILARQHDLSCRVPTLIQHDF